MSERAFENVLDVYKKRIAAESALAATLSPEEQSARRDEFLLEIGEEVARFLSALVIGLDAKIVVEVGTSYGYSTLFLADAARTTGGRLYTYELSREKQAFAKNRLAEARLGEYVEWILGDATEMIEQQPGPIDFALIDLWKDLYIPCFEKIYPKLAATGVVVADNMLHPEVFREHATAYRAAVRAKPDMEGVLLRMGNGIDVSSRR